MGLNDSLTARLTERAEEARRDAEARYQELLGLSLDRGLSPDEVDDLGVVVATLKLPAARPDADRQLLGEHRHWEGEEKARRPAARAAAERLVQLRREKAEADRRAAELADQVAAEEVTVRHHEKARVRLAELSGRLGPMQDGGR